MNYLKLEDLGDIEVEVRAPVRTWAYLLNITLLYMEMTGDVELLDIYEQLFQSLEPYGNVVTTKDEEDGEEN